MKNLRTLAFSVLLATVGAVPSTGQSIRAADARNHVGERAKVCGTVASERTSSSSKGQPTFINLDSPYPHQVFTILIWGENRAHVGTLPTTDSRVCVQGVITEYKGVPEIIVTEPTQLSR